MAQQDRPGRLIARNHSIYEISSMQPIADACINVNGDKSEQHAKRLADCWNALDDLSQDALDGGWTRAGLEAYGLQMKAQRDELLEVLQGVLKCQRGLLGHLVIEGWQEDVIRAAIAKAQGGAA